MIMKIEVDSVPGLDGNSGRALGLSPAVARIYRIPGRTVSLGCLYMLGRMTVAWLARMTVAWLARMTVAWLARSSYVACTGDGGPDEPERS